MEDVNRIVEIVGSRIKPKINNMKQIEMPYVVNKKDMESRVKK